MNPPFARGDDPPRSPQLSRATLHRPASPERNVAHWRINGHPATIFVWTAAEWERLEERPSDAQYYPQG
jgi:hypothetical protein